MAPTRGSVWFGLFWAAAETCQGNMVETKGWKHNDSYFQLIIATKKKSVCTLKSDRLWSPTPSCIWNILQTHYSSESGRPLAPRAELLSSDVFYLDEYKNGLPGLNVNLTSTSFSLDISEKPDRYQEADRGSAFLFHAISDGNSN